MYDFINGNSFSEIADFKIDRDRKELSAELFRKNSIIYCKTDFLDALFSYIKVSGRKYILISHMSDLPLNIARFSLKPLCIKKWYAQNATYDNPNLISIPIGLENHEGGSKGKFTNHQWFFNNIEKLKLNPKSGIYCNWGITNDYRKEMLEKIKLPYHWEEKLSFL